MPSPVTESKAAPNQQDKLKACIKRVANQRDQEAFVTLFDHYAPLLRSYSLAREPGSNLLADELAQEVMIKLWEKAHTYNPQLANLNTWVFTLARNCRIDYLRRNSRTATNIDPAEIFAVTEDEGPGPFQTAHQQRLEENIKAGITQLPQEQADVLHKVFMEGKSHQEASEELRLPLGTVKSRIRLAVKKLALLVRR